MKRKFSTPQFIIAQSKLDLKKIINQNLKTLNSKNTWAQLKISFWSHPPNIENVSTNIGNE